MMLALLYRATHGGDNVFLVATSREAAVEQAMEFYSMDCSELEYLGRVVNLSLGDEEETNQELRRKLSELSEVVEY